MNIQQHIWKIIFALVIVLIVGGLLFANKNNPQLEDEDVDDATSPQAVKTITIGEETKQEPITSYGEVVSISQVDIYPEIQGIIEGVRVQVGSTVQAGRTLLVLNNDSQKQELSSARASLSSAEARYRQIVDGAREVDIANLESAVQSARANRDQAKSNFENTMDSIFATVGDSLQNNLDAHFFINGTKYNARLSILADPISDRYPLDASRVALQNKLEQAKSSASYTDTKAVLTEYQGLVNDLIAHIQAFSDGKMSAPTKDTYLNILRAISQVISTQSSSLANAEGAYKQAGEALTTAENNLKDALDGASSEELAIALADVAQAKARVNSAQLAFNRTVISAPVAGTISDIDVRVGALVGPSTHLATISNESALRIDTSVSIQDALRIAIGDSVRVNDRYDARISAISPSVNTATGEVAVQAVVTHKDANLISGMGVELAISPRELGTSIKVPISAIFVRNELPYVYRVEAGVAVAQAIEVADLYGEYVEVTKGLEDGMTIVASARATEDGAEIEI
ncbi:MAG: efflux RND transporter periplasmic adaptor subunit [Patescibacteria group bacterium]